MPFPTSRAHIAETMSHALVLLGCAGHVAPSRSPDHLTMLELQDEDGEFLAFFPMYTSSETVAMAYRLYELGLSRGRRAGEQAAWAKLRTLIGAASIADAR